MMNNAPLKAEGQLLSNTATGLTNEIQVQQVAEIGEALPAALDRYLPVVIDVAIDPDTLYSFHRVSFKHRGG